MPNLAKSIRSFFKKKKNKKKDRGSQDSFLWKDQGAGRLSSRSSSNYLPNTGATDGDDASSVMSYSTNATMDDNPGPGRLIDKYIYQRFGRKLERLALRVMFPYLSPFAILQHLKREFHDYSYFDYENPLEYTVQDIYKRKNGKLHVAGLKELVKQSQSKSIYRSKEALSALILISTDRTLRCFYHGISQRENIFHLEDLAHSLSDAHPEKKHFLFLATLAKANVIINEVRVPTIRAAQRLREKLACFVELSRCCPFEAIGDACIVFAQVIACMRGAYRGGIYIHILDTFYFFVIFFLHFSVQLHTAANGLELKAQNHILLLLDTFTHWLDITIYRSIPVIIQGGMFNSGLLDATCACISIFQENAAAQYFLPNSSHILEEFTLLDDDVLPRRLRGAFNLRNKNSTIINLVNLLRLPMLRSQRLLHSLDELEREVHDGAFATSVPSIYLQEDDTDLGPSYGEMQYSFYRARSVFVEDSELTTDFLNVQLGGYLLKDEDEYDVYAGLWGRYKLANRLRNKSGQYFRSYMDWDWDLRGSLEFLFKLEDRDHSTSRTSPDSGHAIRIDGLQSDAWKICVQGPQATPPKEVKISYKTETGETRYVTMVSNEPISEGSHAANIGEISLESEAVPQEDSIDGIDSMEEGYEGRYLRISPADGPGTQSEPDEDGYSLTDSDIQNENLSSGSGDDGFTEAELYEEFALMSEHERQFYIRFALEFGYEK